MICCLCHTDKLDIEFSASEKRSHRCRACSAIRAKNYRDGLKANGTYKAFLRKHNLKSSFGMTQTDYDRMFASQDNQCAACGTTENGTLGRAMPVDHDHATGAIRGILCTPCNQAAGHAYDSPDRLEAVAAYLRRHELRETALRLGLIAAA